MKPNDTSIVRFGTETRHKYHLSFDFMHRTGSNHCETPPKECFETDFLLKCALLFSFLFRYILRRNDNSLMICFYANDICTFCRTKRKNQTMKMRMRRWIEMEIEIGINIFYLFEYKTQWSSRLSLESILPRLLSVLHDDDAMRCAVKSIWKFLWRWNQKLPKRWRWWCHCISILRVLSYIYAAIVYINILTMRMYWSEF